MANEPRLPPQSSSSAGFRLERDTLGEREVPADAYWGIHTLRALENFPVSGVPVGSHPELVQGLAAVKRAAAAANVDLGLLPAEAAAALLEAAGEVQEGALSDQFPVDVLQGGAGTSTNMNANEVLANRALELLGEARGSYGVLHPLDHVNKGQSTNDVIPTAGRIGLRMALPPLCLALRGLAEDLEKKGDELGVLAKTGRTQLQDAVPMTLGQELGAFAATAGKDAGRLERAAEPLTEVNLGGTAIGTGLNAPAGFAALALEHLEGFTGMPCRTAANLIEAGQDSAALVELSGALRGVAIRISKICNDLRLLSSGPEEGFGELVLPPLQAGSSMMPGKVNPVIPEAVNQVCFVVISNDAGVTAAAEAAQLQLNPFTPLIMHKLFESIALLRAAVPLLAERCVRGLEAGPRLGDTRPRPTTTGLASALVPLLGYKRAAEVAREALGGAD